MIEPASSNKNLIQPTDRFWDILVFVSLFLLSALYAGHITSGLDLGLYDETAYLQRGLAVFTNGLPSADMAPVYALWYWVLSFFTKDAITLYFFNYKVTMVLVPLMSFVLLRAMGTRRSASVIAAICILITTLNVQNWPRVSLLAMAVLLAAVLVGTRIQDRDRSFAASILITMIAVFVRPEFLLSVGVLFAIWLLPFIRRRTLPFKSQLIAISTALIGVIILLAVFGDPLANGRSMVAFGQHYALNRVDASGSELDPWTNWEEIVAADFGNAHSFSEALVRAPGKVMWHMRMNLGQVAANTTALLMPTGTRAGRFSFLLLIAFVVALLLLNKRVLRARLSELARPILIAMALSGPPLLSSLLINPRAHYLLFPIGLFVLLLVAVAYPRSQGKASLLSSAVPLLLLAAAFCSIQVATKSIQTPVLSTVDTINALPWTSEIAVLEADGGYAVYLDRPTHRFIAQDKSIPFDALLKERSINLIVASPRLMADHRYKDDPEWQRFLDGGYAQTFQKIPVIGTENTLFVAEKDLLSR